MEIGKPIEVKEVPDPYEAPAEQPTPTEIPEPTPTEAPVEVPA